MRQEEEEISFSNESQMEVQVKKNTQWLLKTAQVQMIWMTLQ